MEIPQHIIESSHLSRLIIFEGSQCTFQASIVTFWESEGEKIFQMEKSFMFLLPVIFTAHKHKLAQVRSKVIG